MEEVSNEVGGYFELELNDGGELYSNLIALNSARNALVYLIKAKALKRIRLPYLNCGVVAAAVRRFCPETEIEHYHIDERFAPVPDQITSDGAFYYVNYYGLQEKITQSFSGQNIIIDNAQAFFSPPIVNGDSIYSPRKFFGVSDGGYLKSSVELDSPLIPDTSWEHCSHLLKRIDCGASAAYADFKSADYALSEKPPRLMSRLTRRILCGIDYKKVKERRRHNFVTLHHDLGRENELCPRIEAVLRSRAFIPFCYPYLISDGEALRQHLIHNRIYTPVYWPEVKSSTDLNNAEHDFVNNIVCLPVDQRYDADAMKRILDCVDSVSA
jgi:hypothetical protein